MGVCCNCKRGGKKVGIVLYIPLENPNYDQAKFPFSHSFLPPPPSLYKHQHTCSEFVDESLASVSAFAEERPNLHCYIDIITKFLRGGKKLLNASKPFSCLQTSQNSQEKFPMGLAFWPIAFTPTPIPKIAYTGQTQGMFRKDETLQSVLLCSCIFSPTFQPSQEAEPTDYCTIPIHTKSCVDMPTGNRSGPG